MDYQVHIVDDDELACEWAVVEYAGTHPEIARAVPAKGSNTAIADRWRCED